MSENQFAERLFVTLDARIEEEKEMRQSAQNDPKYEYFLGRVDGLEAGKVLLQQLISEQ